MKRKTKKSPSDEEIQSEETQNLHRNSNEDVIDFSGREPTDEQEIPQILTRLEIENKQKEDFFKTIPKNNRAFFGEFCKSIFNNVLIFLGTFLYLKSLLAYIDLIKEKNLKIPIHL